MISIVTITYNNYEELRSTLDSIANIQDVESIVVNGGSCPKTLDFLKSYNGVSLSEKDTGISDAFNKGVKLSTGDAIMFLNSGDHLIDPEYINECNKILHEKPIVDYLYSDIIFNDELIGPVRINVGPKMKNLAKGMPYPHQSLIIRKTVFDKIGGFNEKLKVAMDFDFVVRMLNANYKIFHYLPIASVKMDGAGVSSKQQLKSIEEITSVLNTHNRMNKKIQFRLHISHFFFFLKKIPFFLKLSKRLKHRIKF